MNEGGGLIVMALVVGVHFVCRFRPCSTVIRF